MDASTPSSSRSRSDDAVVRLERIATAELVSLVFSLHRMLTNDQPPHSRGRRFADAETMALVVLLGRLAPDELDEGLALYAAEGDEQTATPRLRLVDV